MASKRMLTLSEKYGVLKKIEELQSKNQLTMKELSVQLKMPSSTVRCILNNRESIENTPIIDQNRFRARNKHGNPLIGITKYADLELALKEWIKKQKDTVTGPIIRKQALMIASEMGYPSFTASNGWFDRFKKKNKLNYKKKKKLCNHPSPSREFIQRIGSENFIDFVLANQKDIKKPDTPKKQYELIVKYLVRWLKEVHDEGIKVTGALTKKLALTLAGALEIETFTASNGWLTKFQAREEERKLRGCAICQNL